MSTATYEKLLAETCPQVIENDVQYKAIGKRLGDLIGKQQRRTSDETKLMRLLALLVQDYDRRYSEPPQTFSPAARLQFLVEQAGKPVAELLTPIFGQRSHAYEAINGKRAISAAQARKLGKLFSMDPGAFI